METAETVKMKPSLVLSVSYGVQSVLGLFVWVLVLGAVFTNSMWAQPVVLSLVIAIIAGALGTAFWVVLLPDAIFGLALAYSLMPMILGGLFFLSSHDGAHFRGAGFFCALALAMYLSSLCGGWLMRKSIRSSFFETMLMNDDSDSDVKRLLKLCLRYMRGVEENKEEETCDLYKQDANGKTR